MVLEMYPLMRRTMESIAAERLNKIGKQNPQLPQKPSPQVSATAPFNIDSRDNFRSSKPRVSWADNLLQAIFPASMCFQNIMNCEPQWTMSAIPTEQCLNLVVNIKCLT